MLTSLALIFLVGLAMGAICQRLKLPRIIGMLITGIVLGPYVLDFLDSSILSISADLRKMALIIILLKAGLSLNLADLKKANVTVRNFPATVAELRKRIHLAEGGDTYLFASTLNNGQKVLIRCEKV